MSYCNIQSTEQMVIVPLSFQYQILIRLYSADVYSVYTNDSVFIITASGLSLGGKLAIVFAVALLVAVGSVLALLYFVLQQQKLLGRYYS